MSYFGTKFVVFMFACGIVFGQSDNEQINDPDKIIFPGQIDTRRSLESTEMGSNMLLTSLKIAQQINSINSFKEFLQFLNVPEEQKLLISDRIGGTQEKSNAEEAKAANCIPELQMIPLKPEHDLSTFYYPSCTRVKRCGGCCSHYLLSCQPTETITKNFKVLVGQLGKNLQIEYKNKEIIPVEEHTKCKCDCKIKKKDCNEKQAYRRNECRCVCINTDEKEKCISSNIKIWDSQTCTCACRENGPCSTGSYFDSNTCRCRQLTITQRFDNISQKIGYRFGQTERSDNVPPVIVTLDASDPRRKHRDDPEYN